MRNRSLLVSGVLSLLAAAIVVPSSTATASSSSVDLAISSASFVGNAKSIAGTSVIAVFTGTNKSSSGVTETTIYIKNISNLTYAAGDGYCVMPVDSRDINSDGAECDFSSSLNQGGHESSIISLGTGPSGTTGRVTMCIGFNLSGYTDPASSNNCKTISIKNL